MRALPLLLLAACGTIRVKAPPDGYVPVDRGPFGWRGMSAEGAVVGIRAWPREPAGTLEFWSKVVRRELEGRRGYTLLAEEEATAAGLAGRAMLFAVPGNEPRAYYTALFLTGRRIYTVELGGPKDQVERDLPAIRLWMADLRLP